MIASARFQSWRFVSLAILAANNISGFSLALSPAVALQLFDKDGFKRTVFRTVRSAKLVFAVNGGDSF
jgi:hypothetical protein